MGMYGEHKALKDRFVTVDTDMREDRLMRVSVSGDFFLDPDDAFTRVTALFEGALALLNAKDLAARVEAAPHGDDMFMRMTSEAVDITVRRVMDAALS